MKLLYLMQQREVKSYNANWMEQSNYNHKVNNRSCHHNRKAGNYYISEAVS